jgi:hypothetical protein
MHPIQINYYRLNIQPSLSRRTTTGRFYSIDIFDTYTISIRVTNISEFSHYNCTLYSKCYRYIFSTSSTQYHKIDLINSTDNRTIGCIHVTDKYQPIECVGSGSQGIVL